MTEPKEGDWPALSPAGQPYIDPDIVKITELPDWLAGKQAVGLWNQRNARIEQIPKDLKTLLQTNGFI